MRVELRAEGGNDFRVSTRDVVFLIRINLQVVEHRLA